MGEVSEPLSIELLPNAHAFWFNAPHAMSQIVSVCVTHKTSSTQGRFDLGKRVFIDDLFVIDRNAIPREQCEVLAQAIVAKMVAVREGEQ